jgi:predicted amidohydrolase
VLLRARAIESQSWVVAPNQWGRHGGARASYGHTLIVDPWGTIVAECSDRVGFVLADLDHDIVTSVRSALPSLRHRRW